MQKKDYLDYIIHEESLAYKGKVRAREVEWKVEIFQQYVPIRG